MNCEDKYFYRQLFILTSSLALSISMGMMLAYPAVLNAAILRSNSSDIKTTPDHASWIAACNGLSGIPGSLILPPIFQQWGRKAAHIYCNAVLVIGWIIFPLAKDITGLYTARVIQGLAVGGMYIHSTLLSEYVHPTRRGYFVTIKKVFIAIGTLCCHFMQPFLTWRQISIYAIFPPLLGVILTCMWPASPYFLALKGRYEECEKSHRWLHGQSAESEMHLKTIIEMRKMKVEQKKKSKNGFLEYLKTFTEKDFVKAVLISSLLTLIVDLSGRYYLFAYVFEIMKTVFPVSHSLVLYFSIGTDLLTVFAVTISTIFTKYFNRRVLLFVFGPACAVLMLLISLIVYIHKVFQLPQVYMWITASAIIVQSVVISVGVAPMTFILIGEIFPLDHKGKGMAVANVVFTIFYALTLKITPVLMEHTGLYGTYLIYAVLMIVCLFWLYRVLPETKDRTLMDIECELVDDIRMERLIERGRLLR